MDLLEWHGIRSVGFELGHERVVRSQQQKALMKYVPRTDLL